MKSIIRFIKSVLNDLPLQISSSEKKQAILDEKIEDAFTRCKVVIQKTSIIQNEKLYQGNHLEIIMLTKTDYFMLGNEQSYSPLENFNKISYLTLNILCKTQNSNWVVYSMMVDFRSLEDGGFTISDYEEEKAKKWIGTNRQLYIKLFGLPKQA